MAAVAHHVLNPAVQAWMERLPAPHKALFLDRDGVINLDHGYVHTPAGTDWVPGIFELVRSAMAAGYIPVVVTNQAGIARGLYDEAAFVAYTHWVHEEFAARGACIAATFFCPHHPEAGRGDYLRQCLCRKPKPGMILAAIESMGIDPVRSVLVGDKSSDIEAARAAGVGRSILVAPGGVGLEAIRAMFDREAA
ncbi:D-glycero-alpha-D-manno-heptose-1,7-bisphosphate 7-phosphatase [Aerolutibacter ruishenii]|uniref:D-glycero-alpha-D-manno-heptose-1,7-bisphosphate 7-phosphatase n=1 Tax=Aerolutibacter ruishenii TaxID=686800 RepID=UPI00119E7D96|nr:HAD family hydrolase [Lysobacter ruishenii]